MSLFQHQFLARARPLLWAIHGETVRYRPSQGSDRDLTVIWSSGQPADQGAEGLGASTHHASAQARVRVSDLAQPDGRAVLIRHGQPWIIEHLVRQDDFVWLLHLAQPRPERRLPERLRP